MGLNTVGKCRHELADLYRAGRARELDPLDAARLATIVTMISRILEGEALEQRVVRLERLIKGKDV